MNDRNYSIDLMKFFCITGVICVHINICNQIQLGRIIVVLCRVAVPLFLISLGYFFNMKFSKEHSKAYFFKIIKIYVFWSIFYICLSLGWRILTNITNIKVATNYFKEYFEGFNLLDLYYARGIIKYHLWYLSSLIVVVPILYYVIKNQLIKGTLLIAFCLNIMGIFLCNTGLLSFYVTRDAIFFASFYCLIGVYINVYEENIKLLLNNKITYKYILLIIIFFVLSYIEKNIYDTRFTNTGDFFISTIPLSILIFILCIIRNGKKDCILCKIGRNSLGIYLMHTAFIDLISKILKLLNSEEILSNIVWQIIYVPVIIIVSYFSYKFIKSILFKIEILIKKSKKKVVVP